MKILKRKGLCAAALVLLAVGALSLSSSAAASPGQDNGEQSTTKPKRHSRKNTSSKTQVDTTKSSKQVDPAIIFVGGKKRSQGAATKSKPLSAKKSNGALNPQPIPPGKQRQPE